ncbi:MAG: hypothetical protein IJQ39_13140 [Thermoguttaceae bacterium]|nr:hypothetical protein [Thermoguttaceae bacterium]
MINNKYSLIRQIVLSAARIVMVLGIALAVMLFSGTVVNAQLPTNYGKPLIVNGKLQYIPTATHTMNSTSSLGGVSRIFRYEPLGNRFAKVDYIAKSPEMHISLRINGSQYAISLLRKKPQNGSNDSTNRFSGTIKLSSATPAPVPTVADEEKKTDEKNAKEESKTPEQIFPIIVLLQDGNGIIRLLIQTDETTLLDYQVKNVWELYILIPDQYQKDFLELMKNYNPSIFTSEQNMLHRVYNAIAKSVPLNVDNHQEYQRLVDDLSSDVYMKRVAAMNRIQNEGGAFLSFAQKLDLNQLDPEARVRLGNVLNANSFFCNTDDVEDMSLLFTDSFYANISLLESGNPAFSSVAQERLKAKLGDEFTFDASAPNDVRAAQIQELKTKLNFPKPRTIQMDEHVQKRFKELLDTIYDQSLTVFKF